MTKISDKFVKDKINELSEQLRELTAEQREPILNAIVLLLIEWYTHILKDFTKQTYTDNLGEFLAENPDIIKRINGIKGVNLRVSEYYGEIWPIIYRLRKESESFDHVIEFVNWACCKLDRDDFLALDDYIKDNYE